MKNSKYIILDRDGVINIDSLNYIKSADEWNAIPKSLEAIKKLTENEDAFIIISNQSRRDLTGSKPMETSFKLISRCSSKLIE